MHQSCHYEKTTDFKILSQNLILKFPLFNFFVLVFEQYQKARTTFVQTIAELASRPQNIEILQNAGKSSQVLPILYIIHKNYAFIHFL